MNRILRAAFALLIASTLVVAAGVGNGDTWTSGGETITVTYTTSPVMGDVNVTYTDGAGRTSGPHVSTPDPTGGVEAAPEGTLGTGSDTGSTVRIKKGKVQKKNAKGKWVNMRRPRRKAFTTDEDGIGTLPFQTVG